MKRVRAGRTRKGAGACPSLLCDFVARLEGIFFSFFLSFSLTETKPVASVDCATLCYAVLAPLSRHLYCLLLLLLLNFIFTIDGDRKTAHSRPSFLSEPIDVRV